MAVKCIRHNITLTVNGDKRELLMPPMSPNSPMYNPGLGAAHPTDCYLSKSKDEPVPGTYGECEVVAC